MQDWYTCVGSGSIPHVGLLFVGACNYLFIFYLPIGACNNFLFFLFLLIKAVESIKLLIKTNGVPA
jgi:hypothetical protein